MKSHNHYVLSGLLKTGPRTVIQSVPTEYLYLTKMFPNGHNAPLSTLRFTTTFIHKLLEVRKPISLRIGLQDVKTPRNYLDSLQKWRTEMSSIHEKTLEKTVHDLETGQVNREYDRDSSANHFSNRFRIRTHDLGEGNKNEIGLSIDVDIDRELWIS